VADDAVKAIVIIGDERQFSAGADIHLFREIASTDDALRVSRVFQDGFAQFEESRKPVVAALAGQVLGGALELALACHYRVATQDTRFRMPEVNLGINPGAGGTQRLPRLVGIQRALTMLLDAKPLPAEQARQWGLVDRLCEPSQLLDVACQFARDVGGVRRTSELAGQSLDPHEMDDLFGAMQARLAKHPPEIVAPAKICRLVRIGFERSPREGLIQEQQAFAECMATRGTQNKIRLFFSVREVAKIPELAGHATASIDRVGVIGMGTMGTGITQAFLQSGFPVVALDHEANQLANSSQQIRRSLAKRVADGKLAADRAEQMLNRLSTTDQWSEVAGCALVIETVFEESEVKRSVLQQLEQVCAPEAILATNTSTFSLAELARGMRHPERFIGMHFFNPAHRMPLVEVVRGTCSSGTALSTALGVAKSLRKTAVLVSDREGFLVDRVFVPYLQEAFALLEQGATPAQVDEAAVAFGFPMGPLLLIDMAGIDILVQSQQILQRAFPRHGPLSAIAHRLVALGACGQKSGAGVYRYDANDRTPHANTATESLIEEVQRGSGHAPRVFRRQEIIDRLVLRMVNEAFYVLEEDVARRDTDVDVATVLGIGFPDFRGGVIKYATDEGLSSIVDQLDELADRQGERFRASRLLRDRKGVR
jgi:3-hydroxyacyl-CoA dehydrogenase